MTVFVYQLHSTLAPTIQIKRLDHRTLLAMYKQAAVRVEGVQTLLATALLRENVQNDQREALIGDNSRLQRELNRLKADLRISKGKWNEMNDDLAVCHCELDDAKDENAELVDENASLRGKLKVATSKITSLGIKLSKAQHSMKRKEERLARFDRKYEKLKERYNGLRKEFLLCREANSVYLASLKKCSALAPQNEIECKEVGVVDSEESGDEDDDIEVVQSVAIERNGSIGVVSAKSGENAVI